LAPDLLSDHTELENSSRKLRDSLEATKSGAVSQADLKRRLSQFLARQPQHIHIEEMGICPLPERVLTKQDWNTIQSMIPPINARVFGDGTRETGHNQALLVASRRVIVQKSQWPERLEN
jgi:hemerythrin-like domain-containing protein